MASIKQDMNDHDQLGSPLQIDDQQIMTMSVKELNTLLKSMKPTDAAAIKRRRRILKNKGYAASSRHRQTSLVGNLSVERNQLVKQINQLQQENETLSQELRGWKQRYSDLQLLTAPPATTTTTTTTATIFSNTSTKSHSIKDSSK